MVSNFAFFLVRVVFIRCIWDLIILVYVADKSGAIYAPRTLVGLLKGIGEIGIRVPSRLYACNIVEGVSKVNKGVVLEMGGPM